MIRGDKNKNRCRFVNFSAQGVNIPMSAFKVIPQDPIFRMSYFVIYYCTVNYKAKGLIDPLGVYGLKTVGKKVIIGEKLPTTRSHLHLNFPLLIFGISFRGGTTLRLCYQMRIVSDTSDLWRSTVEY